MTEEEFTSAYMDSLKSVCPSGNYQMLTKLVILANYQGNEAKHYLDNAYKEYKQKPELAGDLIMRYVNSSASFCHHDTAGIQIYRIVPLIKPMEYLNDLKNAMKEMAKDAQPNIVYEKYNDQLIIVYGEDTDNNIQYFSEEEFNKLNINKDTLLQFSLKNLKSVIPEIQLMDGEGSFGLTAGGNYETSLLLVNKLWSKENMKVDGDFVIAIPNRDILLITGSNNKTEIARIRTIVKDSYEKGNYPVSPYLFKWDGKKFELLIEN